MGEKLQKQCSQLGGKQLASAPPQHQCQLSARSAPYLQRVCKHEALRHERLRQLDHHLQQVGDACRPPGRAGQAGRQEGVRWEVASADWRHRAGRGAHRGWRQAGQLDNGPSAMTQSTYLCL